MQELAERTISQLHGRHFDIPRPARRIEAMIAPVDDGGIYYSEPSEDWSRPGRMWWSVPSGLDSFATWKEVTTVYHEGVPGHHLQISQSLAGQENLNRWQRLMSWVSGYGEGWATYAERLMAELGYLDDDPVAYLGMLDMQMMSAANVALDIGVHLELKIPTGTGWREGERWNPAIAWEFLRAHSSWDEKRLRFELHRYLGWSGQVPSYKLGERAWLQARDEAKARAGRGLQPQGLPLHGAQPGRHGPGPAARGLVPLLGSGRAGTGFGSPSLHSLLQRGRHRARMRAPSVGPPSCRPARRVAHDCKSMTVAR